MASERVCVKQMTCGKWWPDDDDWEAVLENIVKESDEGWYLLCGDIIHCCGGVDVADVLMRLCETLMVPSDGGALWRLTDMIVEVMVMYDAIVEVMTYCCDDIVLMMLGCESQWEMKMKYEERRNVMTSRNDWEAMCDLQRVTCGLKPSVVMCVKYYSIYCLMQRNIWQRRLTREADCREALQWSYKWEKRRNDNMWNDERGNDMQRSWRSMKL